MTQPDELLDPAAVAVDVGAHLEHLDIAWVIGGSLASSVHGEPRATLDVDIVVALRARNVKPMAKALQRDYYVDAEAMSAAVTATSSFNAVHFSSSVKVDFFVAGEDPFERERLAHRQRLVMPNGVLYIDTAEHTLLRKLEWYRRGGELSERQWRDVVAIARIQGNRLDRDRLSHWADRLGVTDLLQRVLSEQP